VAGQLTAYDIGSSTNAGGTGFTSVQRSTFTYTHTGQLASTTDPDGDVSTTTYDARDRAATEVDGEGRTQAFFYTPDGLLQSEFEAPNGARGETVDKSGPSVHPVGSAPQT